MAKRGIALKDYLREVELFTQRLILLSSLILILSTLLIVRLAYLQIHQHSLYTTLSTQNLLNIVAIEPNRGLIYDRNGQLLAANKTVYSLVLIPGLINHLDQTLKQLQQFIPINDEDIKAFNRLKRQRHRFSAVPLLDNVSEADVATFYSHQFLFKGVSIQAHLMRYYPMGQALAQVLGYVGRINEQELTQLDSANYSATTAIGKTGIEKMYETRLHGQVGFQQVETDASGRIIRTLSRTPPVAGDNLYLSIDANLQRAGMTALQGLRGAVVAIDPRNGQVLAMISMPTFDNNRFVNGLSQPDYDALQQAVDKPLFNRAISALYPPASTIKPFVGLGALEHHFTEPNYEYFDKGWFKLPGSNHVFHDWNLAGRGWVNLHRSIVESCDTYFFNLGASIGITHLDDILAPFGFGQATGIDMPMDLSGLLPSPQWKTQTHAHSWYQGDTVNTVIGQGFMLATPLQLAVAVATLAAHGKRYQPTMIAHSSTADGTVTERQPILLDQTTYSKHNWQIIANAMQGVIQEPRGTGFRFGRDTSYSVAAKTGTAQVFSKRFDSHESQADIPERLRDHSLFITFAPINKPEIAVAVIVENDARAAPIVARKVLDAFFEEQAHAKKT